MLAKNARGRAPGDKKKKINVAPAWIRAAQRRRPSQRNFRTCRALLETKGW